MLGPYREQDGWRIILVQQGTRSATKTQTEDEAHALKRELEAEISGRQQTTVASALELYREHLQTKGNRSTSIGATIGRLTMMLAVVGELRELTPARGRKLYDQLRTRKSASTGRLLAVDTHRNVLAEAKTFGQWLVKQHLLRVNPFDQVEPVGKRSHGKPQLRIDEARAFCRAAHDLAAAGDVGAVAALTTLLMALRASEIVQRVARDVDDGGRLLWIPCAKTKAGKRQVEIPEELQPYYRLLTAGKAPIEPLFGHHWRDWPREQVQRICKLAKVPEVTAHGMRGPAQHAGHQGGSVTAPSCGKPGTQQTKHHAAQLRGTGCQASGRRCQPARAVGGRDTDETRSIGGHE